jgi:hypothetical protein
MRAHGDWSIDQAAIALMPATEEDVPDAIDGEISDKSDRGYADTEEQENRGTVVMEKHEGWTGAGGERSMVGPLSRWRMK